MLKNFALLGVGTGQDKGLVSHLLTSLCLLKSNVTRTNYLIRLLKIVKKSKRYFRLISVPRVK